jgi:Flp pilus assembly protein TadG
MTFTGCLQRFLYRFAVNRDGVSAVEFAFVLPLMLLMYVGSAELGDGLSLRFKVAETARTITDLASQYATIEASDMSTILGASTQVVAPYSAANMIMTVSEVTTNSNGQGTITWSCSLNGTPRAVGSSVTLPANLQTADISLIWGEVTYPYAPQLGFVITGTINIYETAYFYPRLVNSVTMPQGC